MSIKEGLLHMYAQVVDCRGRILVRNKLFVRLEGKILKTDLDLRNYYYHPAVSLPSLFLEETST